MFEKLFNVMFDKKIVNKKTDKCKTFISENREICPKEYKVRTSLFRYFYSLNSLVDVSKKYQNTNGQYNRKECVKFHDLHC